MSLVPVHGGLDEPVNRVLPLSRRVALREESSAWPSIRLAPADLTTALRIADGTLSPLFGFMDRGAVRGVLDDQVVVRRGERFAWTVPIALPVTPSEASALRVGAPAVLVDSMGEPVGRIQVEDVFDHEPDRWMQAVFGTSRTDHPGARALFDASRSALVGGAVQMLPPARTPAWGHRVTSPAVTRAMIQDRGWQKALAFQTRNPLHRAHEYALVHALEQLTRAGHFAGAVLHPLVGQLKDDDVDAATRMLTYQALVDGRLLGEGDRDEALWRSVGYDLHEVLLLGGLDMRMFYAGPAEAVMHAIYRQNHGFTHLVVGRRHADAPFDDGSPIWGEVDAQQRFRGLSGALHIEPVNVGPAAYYASIGRVDLMDRHPDERPVAISGSRIRSLLAAGEPIPAQIMRPEVSQILAQAVRRA